MLTAKCLSQQLLAVDGMGPANGGQVGRLGDEFAFVESNHVHYSILRRLLQHSIDSHARSQWLRCCQLVVIDAGVQSSSIDFNHRVCYLNQFILYYNNNNRIECHMHIDERLLTFGQNDLELTLAETVT